MVKKEDKYDQKNHLRFSKLAVWTVGLEVHKKFVFYRFLGIKNQIDDWFPVNPVQLYNSVRSGLWFKTMIVTRFNITISFHYYVLYLLRQNYWSNMLLQLKYHCNMNFINLFLYIKNCNKIATKFFMEQTYSHEFFCNTTKDFFFFFLIARSFYCNNFEFIATKYFSETNHFSYGVYFFKFKFMFEFFGTWILTNFHGLGFMRC